MTRPCSEHVMTSWDGARLLYRAWLPVRVSDRAIILFHDEEHHSAGFEELAGSLPLDHFLTCHWTARGRWDAERGADLSTHGFVKDIDVCEGPGLLVGDAGPISWRLARVRDFIARAFAEPAHRPSLLHADREGYTKAEYDRRLQPLPTFSARYLWYGCLKFLMQTF